MWCIIRCLVMDGHKYTEALSMDSFDFMKFNAFWGPTHAEHTSFNDLALAEKVCNILNILYDDPICMVIEEPFI